MVTARRVVLFALAVARVAAGAESLHCLKLRRMKFKVLPLLLLMTAFVNIIIQVPLERSAGKVALRAGRLLLFICSA